MLNSIRLSFVFAGFAFLALFLGTVSVAEAAARTASVDGNWTDTATWGGQSVPVAGDDVTSILIS